MAFLGKISAVVAANTSDFSRNIKNAKKDLNNFAASMRGVQLKLDTQSLSGTLTKVQQFQAKIASIRKLLAQGVDAGLPDPGRLQSKFKAFEDLGKPIVSLVKQFEGFSTTIQAELLPELEKAQKGFRRLYNDIDAGTTTFDQAGARIDGIRRQIQGLRQAFAAAGDIGGLRNQLSIEKAGASFFQPNAKESLQESLRLRSEAEKVPAKFRGGAFGQLAFQAEKNADTIEKQAARVAALQLEITRSGETPARLERLAAAQEKLNRAVERQGQINNAFRGRLGVVADAQIAGALSGRFAARSDLRTQSEVDQEQIRRSGRARLRLEGRAGGLTAAKTQGLLLQEQMASSIVPEFSSLQARAAASGDQGFISKIEGLRKNLIEMQGDLNAVENAANFNEAQAATDKYTAKLQGVRGELKKVAADLKTAETASRRFEKFIGIAGAGENRLGADFERAASDVSVARQFVGNFEKDAGRDKALQGIERATDRYRKLLEVQQRVFDDKSISPAKQTAALDKIKEKVKETRAALVGLIAEQSKAGGGAGLSVDQIEGTMERAAKNRGSFNISGMASAQLAMQQGLFAIDDFMSSTGGLEYKLRAIGNNITQLGLMLGQSGLIKGLSATTGLFVGLAVVMGGQVLSSMLRFINGEEQAKDKAAGFNESLKEQKKLADQLAAALGKLADASLSIGPKVGGPAETALEGLRRRREARQKVAEDFAASGGGRNLAEIEGLRASLASVDRRSQSETKVDKLRALDLERKSLEARIKRLTEEDVDFVKGGQRAVALPTADDVAAILAKENQDNLLFEPSNAPPKPQTAEAVKAAIGADLNDPAKQRELLEGALRRQTEIGQKDKTPFDAITGGAESARIQKARDAIEGIRGLINALDQGSLFDAVDEFNTQFDKSAKFAAETSDAFRSLEKALSDGKPAAIGFEQALAASQNRLEELKEQQEKAIKSTDGTPEERAARIRRLTDLVADEQEEQRKTLQNFSDGTAASSPSIASLESIASELGPEMADFARKVAEARSLMTQGRAGDGAAAGESAKLAEKLADTATMLDLVNKGLSKFSEVVYSNSSRAEAAATRADLEVFATDPKQQAGLLFDDRVGAMARAQEREKKQAELAKQMKVAERQARAKFLKDDPMAIDIAGKIRKLDDELRQPGLDNSDRENLLNQQESLRAELKENSDRIASEATKDLAIESEAVRLKGESAERGVELSRSPVERDMLAIARAAEDLGNFLEGRLDLDPANEVAKNLARQFSPMVMQFANERQTADLKGPSRAALRASDITTQQGRSELNRLLRGDDANRDVNLVELQEQTKKLGEIVDAIRNSTGVVVEF